MADIDDAGTVRVGTKFDQPGFGLQNLEGTPEGFDVEIAKIIAGKLGVAPDDDRVGRGAVPGPRAGARGRPGRHGRRHLHDQRGAQASASPSPAPTTSPVSSSWSRPTTTPSPARTTSRPTRTPKVCSVSGSTPSESIREYLASDDQLVLFDVLRALRRRAAHRAGRRRDDRQRHPAGFVAEAPEAVQARRRAVHRGAVRHRRAEGRHRVLRVRQHEPGRRPPTTAPTPRPPGSRTAGQFEGIETPELPELEPCPRRGSLT